MIDIRIENPDQPEIRALLEASDAYMAALYPAQSNHLLDVASLQQPRVAFLVARVDGRALGCGAVLDSGEGWAEVKRMFVSPAARGMKLGRRLLEELETLAAARGARWLRLETGGAQPEALGLYRSAGFVEIGPFGAYRPDPLSIFMEKSIAPAPRTRP
ncbi:MAG TPA: GNAT family N-acetyltransferase [Steroidobacteraceae bacterium]|nr:GNAT family N-acetyltransferase [Steroidobacteraceae bacterium]